VRVTAASKICEVTSENFHLLAKISSNCAHRFPRPFNNSRKVIMVGGQRTSFDPETLLVLRQTLDDAWESLTPVQRAMTSRTLLAERILKSAAKGERNPDRLRDEALMLFAA